MPWLRAPPLRKPPPRDCTAAPSISGSTLKSNFKKPCSQARSAYTLALREELQDLSDTAFATLRSLLTDPKTTIAVRQRLALAYLARWQFADTQLDGILPADWQSDSQSEQSR